MKAKQNFNPDQKVINHLLDLNKKRELLVLEKELIFHLKEFQDSPFLHNLLGVTLSKQGRIEESLGHFNQAIKGAEKKSVYLINLAISLSKMDRVDEAINAFSRSIDLDGSNFKAHFLLGNAFRKAHRIDEAVISYDNAVKINPSHADALIGKSLSLKNLGKFEQSLEICKKAIDIRPDFGFAHRHITAMLTYEDAKDPHIAEMESIYNHNSLQLEDRIQLAFGLGKCFEDVKNYKKAFFYLNEGNKLHRKTIEYTTEGRKERVSDIKVNFTKDFFNSSQELSKQGKKIIFVLGMPRSGTSLVEQILASHSRVYGAGEKGFLAKTTFKALFPIEEVSFPRNLSLHDQKSFDNLGRDYVRMIENLGKDEGRLVVDKMPYNFEHIGVIHKALPEAKIILCERDPLDNCFSIFKAKFGAKNEYAYNLEEIGEYYNLYLDLIAHWESVLPNKLHRVKYEELISNQEIISREMINVCDLDWEEDCMSFHSTKRTVITASAAQVRQPLYASSVGLWKKYETELEPLIKILKKEN